ncbi:MAG: hypothetical protein ACYDH9_20655 [Limisphaerales bacterium]
MAANQNPANSKISERQIQLRRQLWPHLTDADLWLRLRSKGFTTIPRTMPLILRAMDALSKGKPVSPVYLELWCRTFDECFVVLNKPTEMAFGSGFAGQRADQTWLSRVKILSTLGFIDTQPGPSGPVSYAVLLNPYKIIMKHHRLNTPGMTAGLYNALVARANEIGARDLMEPEPVPPTAPRPVVQP